MSSSVGIAIAISTFATIGLAHFIREQARTIYSDVTGGRRRVVEAIGRLVTLSVFLPSAAYILVMLNWTDHPGTVGAWPGFLLKWTSGHAVVLALSYLRCMRAVSGFALYAVDGGAASRSARP